MFNTTGLCRPPQDEGANIATTAAIREWQDCRARKTIVRDLSAGYSHGSGPVALPRGSAADKNIAAAAAEGRARMSDVNERFQNLHEFLKVAKNNLNRNNWDYIVGATETETTIARNRQSLDCVAFRPRILRNVQKVNTSSTFYGRKVRLPVLIAPVGGLQLFWPGGVAEVAAAAGEFGVPMMQSSATEPALEDTAKRAPNADKVFQLYVRGDDTFVDDFYNRSQEAGFAPQFCITVDLAHYSRRERDLVKRHSRWSGRNEGEAFVQAGLDWALIERFQKRHPKAEIIIKGIQTGEDAQLCIDNGIKGIYVTNHGGRALDHARGTVDMLEEVVDVVKGRVPVIVDGGIYRGTDVIKAMALGATAVGLGRLYCYALAAAGAPGIVRMLELLEDEIRRDLGLMGCDDINKVDRSYIAKVPPVKNADVFSSYHLGDYKHDPY
jgi:isopentenyl diphosphate isomerase/L-lactate dehydrogenase-like FMN-dependent dehydrogenase